MLEGRDRGVKPEGESWRVSDLKEGFFLIVSLFFLSSFLSFSFSFSGSIIHSSPGLF